jgi:hypothetical protein
MHPSAFKWNTLSSLVEAVVVVIQLRGQQAGVVQAACAQPAA